MERRNFLKLIPALVGLAVVRPEVKPEKRIFVASQDRFKQWSEAVARQSTQWPITYPLDFKWNQWR